MVITYSQGLKDRGGGLWNIICQNFVADKQIFNLVFRFFVNVEKYIPTKLTCKSVVSEHSFILVCLILHPRVRGGVGGLGGGGLGHWWNWVLIIMLCKLSYSFYKNPHHLEEDFIDDYTCMLWWFVHTYKIGTKTNFNLLLKMFSIQKISFILEYKFISMTPQKSWICKGVLLVMGNNKMP